MLLGEFSSLTIFFAKVSGILLVSFILAWLSYRVITKALLYFSKTPSHWDDTLLEAARPVVSVGLFLFGVSLSLNLVLVDVEFNHYDLLNKIRRVALIFLIYLLLIRYLKLIRNSFTIVERNTISMDNSTLDFIIKLLQIVLTIMIIMTILQNLGVSIGGFLAFGGVGGLAVGLAAKDMLANLFGGLTLYMDRPFVRGDKISLQDNKISGFVEYIGWRQTVIRGYDRTPIYVPNAIFTSLAVVNPSRMENRRISFTIGIRYQDFNKINPIVKEITQQLQSHESLDLKRGAVARFSDYGTSSLNILIRCFTLDTQWDTYMQTKHDLLIMIGNIVHDHQADFAFPTQTLDLPNYVNIKLPSKQVNQNKDD